MTGELGARPTIRVTIWNEFGDERTLDTVKQHYPDGIHVEIARALEEDGRFTVRTATLDEPEHGLSAEVLDGTDVLLWWGHRRHGEVSDEVAARVQERVLEGMGFIALHSAHFSKPFTRLMGTRCTLKWRHDGERERVWNLAPWHSIAAGVGEYFELELSEMYGERFEIPEPETVVFSSWYQGGELFRSGCVWTRGNGRVFFFSPGHETFPIYHDATVRKILANAAAFCAARVRIPFDVPQVEAIESIPSRP